METVLRKWRPPGRTSGEMSFPRIRRNGWLYVDKTCFLRPLEDERYDLGRLTELFAYAGERGIPLYVLIDEYDNFANTVLAHRGREAYESFTHGGGFYRNFFATLKAGTGEAGGLERLFVTGVSPITMDDVTSGWIPPAWVTVLQSALPRYGWASCGLGRQ